MTSSAMTDRDEQVLKFVREYYQKHGFAPSLREIMDACGLKSSSAAKWAVDRLILMGHLRGSDRPGLARAFSPVMAVGSPAKSTRKGRK